MGTSRLKTFSIKFGLICGLIVTATSTFNAVLESIEKWQQVFIKTETIDLSTIHLEQTISGGGDNIRISKTIIAGEQPQPSVDFLEDDVTYPVIDTEKLSKITRDIKPTPKTIVWLVIWYIFVLIGILMTLKFYNMDKKQKLA